MNKTKQFGCCFKFFNCFEIFDMFGSVFQFRINNNNKSKTAFGGFISSIYFVLCLIYVLINFNTFLMRQNLNMISTYKVIKPTPNIPLKDIQFAFGLFFNLNNTSADEILQKYFTIKISLFNWNGYDLENIKIPINTRPCNYEDFPSILKEELDSNLITKSICPIFNEVNLNSFLYGSFSDTSFQNLDLTLEIKKDYLNKLQEVEDVLNNYPLYSTFYIIDTKIDYDSYSQMTSKYLKSYRSSIDFHFYKYSNLGLSVLSTKTDNNILFKNPIELNETVVQSSENDVSCVNRYNTENELQLIFKKITIKSNPQLFIFERTYEKITSFLSHMTGILLQMSLILYFIINYSNEKIANQKILNKFMKYKENDRYDLNLIVSLLKDSSVPADNTNINKTKNLFEKSSQEDQYKSVNENLRYKYSFSSRPVFIDPQKMKFDQDLNSSIKSNKFLKTKPLPFENNYVYNINSQGQELGLGSGIKPKISFNKIITKRFEDGIANKNFNNFNSNSFCLANGKVKLNSLQIIFPFCIKNRHKLKLIEKVEEKVNHYMDVLTYMKCIREVNLLKYLILSKDQRNIFNFLSKPLISISEIKTSNLTKIEKEMDDNNKINKELIGSVYSSFNKLKSESNTNTDNDKRSNYHSHSYKTKQLLKLLKAEIENLSLI